MAKKKDKIKEIIDSKQAPGINTAGKKRYYVDHKIIWDGNLGPIDPKTKKRQGGVLVTAEGERGTGRKVIETSDSELQKKLEARGYSAEHDNKAMHTAFQVKPESIKSADQVEKENK